ncbi:MAG: hypothetical protein B6U68_01985 [Candidatus Aenigmarchaeota archaeon ex4484_14]|nr:MAG: hypothetical protein B6U68_01985 [Candidatus Aenigmarchaeota archaeon ex4484_14]
MGEQKILVRTGEIFLKSSFVFRQMRAQLIGNLKREFRKRKLNVSVYLEEQRIILKSEKADQERISDILRHTFGVVSFSFLEETEPEITKIKTVSEMIASRWKKGTTFAVHTKRIDKSFRYKSRQINEIIGSHISGMGYKVDLSNPDNVLYIEIGKNAILFDNKIYGPGGLPLSSAPIFSQLDTEKDIVATWFIMKRGFKPMLGISSKKKLVKMLERWSIGHSFSFVENPLNNFNDTEPLKKGSNDKTQKIKAIIISDTDITRIDKIKKMRKHFLVLTPLVGMNADDIEEKLRFLYM